MNRRHFVLACAVASAFPAPGAAREVHGSTDSYAAPGIALAWAVLRGAGDAATVVIRAVVEPKAFSSLAVTGIDPFTKEEATLLPATAVTGAIDIRIPRERFAAFPRTEIRLSAATGTTRPEAALTVFYLGVPDTTPEFNDATKLDAYLSERLARARAGTK
jgi:hypothetical protein